MSLHRVLLAVSVTVLSSHARAVPTVPPHAVIDQTRWGEIRARIEPHLAKFPEALLHVHDLLLPGRLAGAFAEGERAPGAVADMLAGEAAAHGTITSHTGRIVIDAPRDTCWLVVSHFGETRGGEDASFEPHVSDLAAVQPFRFRLGQSRAASDTYLGFCTTRSVTWRADVALAFAGSKTDWRWVAVRWSRALFPAFVAARVMARPSEACHPDAWMSAILTPVPGAIVVSRRGEIGFLDRTAMPYWVYAQPLVGEGTINLSLSGRGANVVPERLSLPTEWVFGGCGDALDPAYPRPSVDPRVAKLERCEASVAKRFTAAIERAEERRDLAVAEGAMDALQREVDRLYEAEERATTEACGAMAAAIQRDMDRALRAVADHFATRPALLGPDVPAYLQARSRTLEALGFALE